MTRTVKYNDKDYKNPFVPLISRIMKYSHTKGNFIESLKFQEIYKSRNSKLSIRMTRSNF